MYSIGWSTDQSEAFEMCTAGTVTVVGVSAPVLGGRVTAVDVLVPRLDRRGHGLVPLVAQRGAGIQIYGLVARVVARPAREHCADDSFTGGVAARYIRACHAEFAVRLSLEPHADHRRRGVSC